MEFDDNNLFCVEVLLGSADRGARRCMVEEVNRLVLSKFFMQ